jgi:hypothetical protein
MGVSCDGKFKFLLLPLVRGRGHVISNLWAYLTVVLATTLLTTEVDDDVRGAAAVMVTSVVMALWWYSARILRCLVLALGV